jgi:CPA2 family monovalent cation:H+ antiporter-2
VRDARWGFHPPVLVTQGAQTFIAATVLLMGATPFLAQLGGRLERRLGREVVRNEPPSAGEATPLRDHVIIAGYGEGGKKLAGAFSREGTEHLILTLSPGGASEAARGRATGSSRAITPAPTFWNVRGSPRHGSW